MLHESDQLENLLAHFASDPVRGFTLRKLARARADGKRPRLFVDDPVKPAVLLVMEGASLHATGALQALQPAFADLLAGRVQANDGWPTPELAADWAKTGSPRSISFNASSFYSWRAAVLAGFKVPAPQWPDENEFIAFQWTWQGTPRFSGEVRHPCRMVEPGDFELLELIKQGVPYDPQGEYIRECLANGPSFVVELPSGAAVPTRDPSGSASREPYATELAPVAWACTHLTGFMGMLYTPEQHRRKGYARSLWAFQIDAMLARDGIACCHVLDYNTPSMQLMQGLGGTPLLEPVVWRRLEWPEGSL